jgi:dTDP-4-amino-4,6-dideoxygalactose transaminase
VPNIASFQKSNGINIDAEKMNIPFNKLYLTGKKLEYMQESIKSGNIIGNAEYTHKCEDLLEETFNAKKVLLTNSCIDALEMASLLIDLEPDDEVIVPSYNFVSTVNAFILRVAKPISVDICEDSLNINEIKIEEKITDKRGLSFQYIMLALPVKWIR